MDLTPNPSPHPRPRTSPRTPSFRAPGYLRIRRRLRSPPAGGRDQGTPDAKGQVAGLAHGTVEAGKHTVGVAREHASAVAAEAGRRGKNLLRQAQEELGQQAFQGPQRLVAGAAVTER